jgi:hypothetical protein
MAVVRCDRWLNHKPQRAHKSIEQGTCAKSESAAIAGALDAIDLGKQNDRQVVATRDAGILGMQGLWSPAIDLST